MIAPDHRQKLTDAKYFKRLLRHPWQVRCLPSDASKQDQWLPLPPDAYGEVQTLYEAALGSLPVEMADYAVCRPRLVQFNMDHTTVKLTPPNPADPPVIWLRWYTTRSRTNLLIRPNDRTYYLTSGPTFLSSDVPNVVPTEYRKTRQLENWLAWLSKGHPDIHEKLLATRP